MSLTEVDGVLVLYLVWMMDCMWGRLCDVAVNKPWSHSSVTNLPSTKVYILLSLTRLIKLQVLGCPTSRRYQRQGYCKNGPILRRDPRG